jgi:hypothetical protein
MSRFRFALYPLVLAVAVGCSGLSPDAPTVPDEVPTTFVNFTGTLGVNGAFSHPFTVSQPGTMAAALADVTPDGVIVGLSLGTWNGSTCIAVFSSDLAAEGLRIIGAASAAGNFCVRIHDTGHVVVPTKYTIQLEHP